MNVAGDSGRLQRIIVVLAAALLMTWLAVYNGYALIYPDSMSYLSDGMAAGRAVLHHGFSYEYGRSPLYSLVLLPLHRNVTPWPIVAWNALLTAYVLWLVVRSVLSRRTLSAYLSLVAALCLFTDLAWFVALIMPDILGPVLYLSIYLMVFAWDTLSRAERVAIPLLAWWAVASHASHLILAGGLCLFLPPFLALRREPARQWLSAVGRVAMVVGLAAAAQVGLNTYLYGKPSLSGRRPPFLMARVIADGPGRLYLQQHCATAHWSICDHLRELPDNVETFLWATDGIWISASEDGQDSLREDERPVVLGTVREFPGEELRLSASHFWRQLHTFGLGGYGPKPWVLQMFDSVLAGTRERYLRSRETHLTLHEEFFASVQDVTVIFSVLVIGLWTLRTRRMRRKWPPRLIGLTTVIAFVVIANAAVTGILANVEPRYQARVIWLVPLLAGVCLLAWLDQRRIADGPLVAKES